MRWARTNLVLIADGSTLMANPESPSYSPNPPAEYTVSKLFYHLNPTEKDPCNALIPIGAWRLPTVNEVSLLINAMQRNAAVQVVRFATSSNNNGGLFGLDYPADADDVVKTNYPKYLQNLFFPLAGYLDGHLYGYGYAETTDFSLFRTFNYLYGRYWVRNADRTTKLFNISASSVIVGPSDWSVNIIEPSASSEPPYYLARCVRSK